MRIIYALVSYEFHYFYLSARAKTTAQAILSRSSLELFARFVSQFPFIQEQNAVHASHKVTCLHVLVLPLILGIQDQPQLTPRHVNKAVCSQRDCRDVVHDVPLFERGQSLVECFEPLVETAAERTGCTTWLVVKTSGPGIQTGVTEFVAASNCCQVRVKQTHGAWLPLVRLQRQFVASRISRSFWGEL